MTVSIAKDNCLVLFDDVTSMLSFGVFWEKTFYVISNGFKALPDFEQIAKWLIGKF